MKRKAILVWEDDLEPLSKQEIRYLENVDHNNKWQRSYPNELNNYLSSGNSKVLNYLLKVKDEQNVIFGTIRRLALDMGVSFVTVSKVFTTLQKKKLLTMRSPGCYVLNPQVMSDGRGYMHLLLVQKFEEEM